MDPGPSREQILPQSLENSRLKQALSLLFRANDYAASTNSNRWEFATEIEQLHHIGLNNSDLRFLVCERYLEHARETTTPEDDRRKFRATGSLHFTRRTCFTLTAIGTAAAAKLCEDLVVREIMLSQSASTRTIQPAFVAKRLPIWDSQSRVLSFDGRIVKHFKWQAINQERVLNAFEEEHWPPRIFDPLCPQPSQDMKRRLSDTIKCLNQRHHCPLLRFRGDGTGEGIVWEAVSR